MYGLSDNSVRSVYLGYIYPMYYMASLFSVLKSAMIAQVDVFATWVYMFQELNTIPNPPENVGNK